jgi:hypothetical protein
MSHANATRRLGLLAVGLGIGAAVAATSGIASADSTDIDPAAFDPSALIADPVPAIPGLDLAISIGGIPLFQSGTAYAESGTDDIAIAYGNDAGAISGYTNNPGTGDYAFADGDDSFAGTGIGNDNSAISLGSGSTALAGAGDGNTAFADGSGTFADAGGTYTSGTVSAVVTAGNDNYASAFGNDDYAYAGAGFADPDVTSTGDIATIIGNGSDAYAGGGDYDFAGALGEALTSTATDGSNLVDLMPSL